MSRTVTIGANTFNYPDAGQNPSWGEDASDAFVELVDQVNVVAQGLISGNLSLALATSDTDVAGLIFSSSVTTGAKIEYRLAITGLTNPTDYADHEEGTITVVYANSVWSMSRTYSGKGAGFYFNITPAGQITYKNPNTSYSFTSASFKFKTITTFGV